MIGYEIRFHPKVKEDIKEAYNWYEEQQADLGESFLTMVELGLKRIETTPWQYPFFDENIRRVLLSRFPYLIAYRLVEKQVVILAVMHTKRNPEILVKRNKQAK